MKNMLTLSYICLIFIAEFTQGMILPTANGVAKLQSSSQSKAKLDKTQVGADSRLQKISRHQHFTFPK